MLKYFLQTRDGLKTIEFGEKVPETCLWSPRTRIFLPNRPDGSGLGSLKSDPGSLKSDPEDFSLQTEAAIDGGGCIKVTEAHFHEPNGLIFRSGARKKVFRDGKKVIWTN